MEMNVETLYQKYGPMVLRRCRWLLKDEDKAFDAMQDVFVQFLKSREQYQDSPYLSSLLNKIATNICLNIIRFHNRHPETREEKLLQRIAVYDDFTDRIQVRDLLHRIFFGLKESTKMIAVLHLVDGLTLEQVAVEVGMSVSGVRKRLRQLMAHARSFKE